MYGFERALQALPHTVLLPLLEPREISALARCSRAALAFGGAEAHWRWLVTRDFCSTVLQAPTSPVGTWRAMYATLDSLQCLRWRAFENAGGKKLRSWRTDRREVSLLPAGALRGQREARLIASGGKFFFQVFSASVADIVLERRALGDSRGEFPLADPSLSLLLVEEGGTASASAGAGAAGGAAAAASAAAAGGAGGAAAAAPGEDKGTRHPFAISKPQLRKIKLSGTPPCPRRAHTTTCVQLAGLCGGGKDGSVAAAAEHVLVCFGGDDDALSPASEADSAMNDVHVLHELRFGGSADQGKGAWVRPPVSGEPPVPRCNHCAVSLGRGKIAIVGGSRGRTSLQACEVSVLEVRRTTGMRDDGGGGGGAGAVAACGEHSQPSITVRWARMQHRVPLPPARQNFRTTRRARDGAIIVFGGMQWGVSTALVSSYAIRIVDGRGGQSGGGESGGESGGGDDSLGEYHTETEQCAPVGDFPGERVGHGMCAIGAQLVVFGGDCTRGGASTAEDDGNAIFTFDARRSRWTRREVGGPGPGQRRGADCQRWGFSIFTAGGFTVPAHAPIADSDSRELVIGEEAVALLGSSPPCPPRGSGT